MSANVSLANAGTSLNFDGQVLQNQQEAEMEREEQIQQNELRQLLSNAFDDLDDDILSVASSEEDFANNSHVSSNHVSIHEEHSSSGANNSISIPSRTRAGALSQSIKQLHPAQHRTKEDTGYNQTPGTHSSTESVQKDSQWPFSDGGDNDSRAVLLPDGASDAWRGHGHQTEAGVTEGTQQAPIGTAHYRPAVSAYLSPPVHHTAAIPQYTDIQHAVFHPSSVGPLQNRHDDGADPYFPPASSCADEFPNGGAGYGVHGGVVQQTALPSLPVWAAAHPEQPSVVPFSSHTTPHSDTAYSAKPNHTGDSHFPQSNDAEQRWNIPMNNTNSVQGMLPTNTAYPAYLDPHPFLTSKERWKGGDEGNVGGDVEHAGGGVDGQNFMYGMMAPAEDKGDNYDHYTVQYKKKTHFKPAASTAADLKVNFIRNEGDGEEASQLAQLQMLYQSRGRQLEDVRGEIEKVTQDSAKERRMLKHLLTMATGEKEGIEGSLKQSQQMLLEVREELSRTQGELQSSQAQLKAMTDSKEELVQKLQSAETAVESLSHQVAGLQGTDSLTQARHQHDIVVNSMQLRFDAQLLDLKQQLDLANSSVSNKTEEIARLQDQLKQQTRQTEEAQISRGETINKLTRSLEESQQRCHALLNASSNEESSRLKAQLQQTLMSKKMADDMCKNLQSEIEELKEQLNMLESATSLGAFNPAFREEPFPDDSMTDLGIRKTLDFSSADSSTRFDDSQSAVDLVGKLRKELERCVTSNRQKRAQLGDLQQETRRLQQDVTQLKQQLTDTQHTVQVQQVKLNSYEERLGGSLQPSAEESRLKRELDAMLKERDALQRDVEEYQKRLNEMSTSEEKLTEINSQLKQQMSAMVNQHDADMRQAIDRCRQTSEDVHRTASEQLEHRLRSELFADKQELIMKYEEQLASVREELQTAQEELDKVKDLYVQASQDLVRQEEVLRSKDKDVEEAIAAEKARWESERDVAMEKVWQQRLQKARSDWETEKQHEAEKDWQQRIKTERQQWEAERQSLADQEWQQRLQEERRQWAQDRETSAEKDLLQQLESERQKWEAERQAVVEKEWTVLLEKEKQQWELEKTAVLDAEWQQRLERERKQWESESQVAREAELESRLEKERRNWQVETDRQALEQANMAVDKARQQWQQDTQDTLKVLNGQLEECRSQHQTELVTLENKWRQEVEDKEKQMVQHLQHTMNSEVNTRLNQQKKVLTEQAENNLQQELSRAQERHAEELRRRVKEEGERVRAEARKQAEVDVKTAVDAARSQWETHQRKQQQLADEDVQEVTRLKEDTRRLQEELTKQKEMWSTESSRLVAEKDEERRQAVAHVRTECQSDYQRLMEDSRTRLDAALDTARQHHQQQLGEVESRYKEELAALRVVEQDLRKALSSATSDSDKFGSTASASHDKASQAHQADKMKREIEKLKKEIEKRDHLLQQADSHMGQEVQRLKESLADNYSKQREKDTLRMQAQYSQALQIGQKERTRLELQLEQLMAQLGQDKRLRAEGNNREEELQKIKEENEGLISELASLQAEKEKLQRAVEQGGVSKQRLQQIRELQQEKDQLSQTVAECQSAVHRASLNKDLMSQEHKRVMSGLQQRFEQSQSHAKQLEAALKAVNKQHKQDMDSLHADHKQKMAAVISQMQKQHSMALEELQEEHRSHKTAMEAELQEHQAEKLELVEELERRQQADTHSMMEEVRQHARRALANTPTQTEGDDDDRLKVQFSHVVQKMMEAVMSHVSQSNERAASTMKVEIRRERQRTIHHLRQRCRSRLHQILHSHLERFEKPSWPMLDQALDSLFDTVSSSCSATPNTSTADTPRSSEGDMFEGKGEEEDSMDREVKSVVNHSHSSALFSTPQSTGSEHYALPASLSQVQLEHQHAHASLEDLHSSGVFYSLQPDDTTSVTDSELEFKEPWPVRKARRYRTSESDRLVSDGESGKKRFTPPKGKRGLSVFAHKDVSHSEISLLSPKLHKQEKGEGDAWRAEDEDTGRDAEETGWKEVKGQGWTAAVGSSNLWQAYSDLRTLEMEDKDPRRQLYFTSVDTVSDSDASLVSSQEGGSHKAGGKVVAPERRTAFKRGNRTVLSRSEDFTRKDLSVPHQKYGRDVSPVARKSPSQFSPQTVHSNTPGSVSVMSDQPDRDTRHTEYAGRKHTAVSAHSPQPVCSPLSFIPQPAKQSASSLSSKRLLDPKDFVAVHRVSPGEGKEVSRKTSHSGHRDSRAPTATRQGTMYTETSHSGHRDSRAPTATRQGTMYTETSHSGHKDSRAPTATRQGTMYTDTDTETSHSRHKDSKAPTAMRQSNMYTDTETLGSLLHRIGIEASDLHTPGLHSALQHKHQPSKDRKPDHVVVSSSSPGSKAPADMVTKPDGRRAKTRTRSADDVSKHPSAHHQHQVGKSLSIFRPHQSTQAPSYKSSHKKQHGQGKDVSIVQRSLEDLPHHTVQPALSHSSKMKWSSEQALHVLREAVNEGQEEFSYTPLQHLLPPPSPSTSLLSTYSVSEGDLRHLPQHLAWNGHIF